MANYYQKVYDSGASRWCYYVGTSINASPLSGATTPNWVGPITQHCVIRVEQTAGGSGDVVGPASATDNAVVRFDSTTGKLVQNSAVLVSDTSGDITFPNGAGTTVVAPANSVSAAGRHLEVSAGNGNGGGNSGGNLILDAGAPGIAANGGIVQIGVTDASQIQSGSGSTGWVHSGSLTVEGSLFYRTDDRSVSSDVSLDNTDEAVRVDASGANRTLTLPDPASKRKFIIKKTDTGTNTVSLARFAAEQIEGTGATFLLPGSAGTGRPGWIVWSDGTNWWVI